MKYSVPDAAWPEEYGNHRAVIRVDEPAGAVELDIRWRRHDANPQDRKLLIINAVTGDTIPNILRKEINNESCRLVFGPVGSPGIYHFYYLPYAVQEGYGFYYKNYIIPEDEPDPEWVISNHLNDTSKLEGLPNATCLEIQARTEFDSFFPMEIIATEEEKQALLEEHTGDFMVFPEDRIYPIRMKDNIPLKWISEGVKSEYSGEALKNEYFTFQLGVWAAGKDIRELKLNWSSLVKGKDTIPASSITCFNTEGIDTDGNYFIKDISISKGNVQALWFGADIPEDAAKGTYKGKITIKDIDSDEKTVDISMEVKNSVIADRGDSEPWRHSRLRWLNSTAGIDKNPVKPFSPIQKTGQKSFQLTGSRIDLTQNGLPEKIAVKAEEVLSSPIRLDIITSKSDISEGLFNLIKIDEYPGEVNAEYQCDNKELKILGSAGIESDGYIRYNYTLIAKEKVNISDVKLVIPFRKEIAEYMMGMGLPGTKVPENHKAGWEGPHDSFWIGNTYGGIHCELRGAEYHGPLINLYKPSPPESWHNNGLGTWSILKSGNTVLATVSSGQRELKEGEAISFEFALLVTPVHELDPARQFTERYYHNGGDPAPIEEELEAGVKIVNLHHANEYNPHINYPFIATGEMRAFVDKYHSSGQKVKIYYTIRELTNWVTEIWALRSLGDEILAGGRGGGHPWLREHFIKDYTPQWYQRLDSLKVDASVLTSTGESRWFNYYVEGLGWLVENIDIDGLYLDDVSFDRRMLKRMRKVMEERKPGCIIDLHSNTGFSKGPATQYAEFFPYVDKLWFGESFQYNEMSPANWLVEVSGIPFGLMGDMLHGGGNPWRGMIYGMTVRYPWLTEGVTCNPRDIWKIWDDFGIAESEMTGYWDRRSAIKTSHEDVLLSYYEKDDSILISIASWSEKPENIRIIADWKSLGLNPSKHVFQAPAIENFQPAASFSITDEITVDPKKGWLLIVKK